MAVHKFTDDLQFSEAAKAEMFWEDVYHRAFPNLVTCVSCFGNYASQRQGVDRLLMLENGHVLKVEEKCRRTEYNDILLEYLSVDTANTPGWIEKDLPIDYLAYGFILSRRCYLFPWPFLRYAWNANKENWRAAYKPVEAKNDGYSTWSLPIPTDVLYRAVNRATRIDLRDSVTP
jgi:hypothetical protein